MLEKGVAIGAILTLVVGMTQFIFKLRYCEVDDVVDNVIGTIIGVKLSVYLWKGIAVVYKIKKVGLFDFSGQIRVNSILYNCVRIWRKNTIYITGTIHILRIL